MLDMIDIESYECFGSEFPQLQKEKFMFMLLNLGSNVQSQAYRVIGLNTNYENITNKNCQFLKVRIYTCNFFFFFFFYVIICA